jgi:flagellar biosynthetic protein FliR
VGAFLAASPIYSRAVPFVGRLALATVLGFSFAAAAPALVSLGSLFQASLVNIGIGLALGFLTGLIFHLFSVAGSLIDFSSSFSAASLFDPVTGRRTAVFDRAFTVTAITLFLVIGGDRLLIRGLDATFDIIPVDGSLSLQGGLAEIAVELVGRMFIAAIELAAPALAALFVAEAVLGVAARFTPQTNVFLIGLPVKVIAALITVVFVVLLFPETIRGAVNVMEDTFIDVVRSMAATGA